MTESEKRKAVADAIRSGQPQQLAACLATPPTIDLDFMWGGKRVIVEVVEHDDLPMLELLLNHSSMLLYSDYDGCNLLCYAEPNSRTRKFLQTRLHQSSFTRMGRLLAQLAPLPDTLPLIQPSPNTEAYPEMDHGPCPMDSQTPFLLGPELQATTTSHDQKGVPAKAEQSIPTNELKTPEELETSLRSEPKVPVQGTSLVAEPGHVDWAKSLFFHNSELNAYNERVNDGAQRKDPVDVLHV